PRPRGPGSSSTTCNRTAPPVSTSTSLMPTTTPTAFEMPTAITSTDSPRSRPNTIPTTPSTTTRTSAPMSRPGDPECPPVADHDLGESARNRAGRGAPWWPSDPSAGGDPTPVAQLRVSRPSRSAGLAAAGVDCSSWGLDRDRGRCVGGEVGGLPDPDAVGDDRLGRGPPLLCRAVVDHEEPRVGRGFSEQRDALRVVLAEAVGE